MEMANYILKILRSELFVMFSWGFSNPIALANEKGLKFKVNGFKNKGWVEVIYDEGMDLFIVNLLKRNGEIKKQVTEVYFDTLVNVIDNLVEKTDDYEQKIKKEYNLIQF